MTKPCRKSAHPTRSAAIEAGRKTKSASFDFGFWKAYLCTRCKLPDGRRAWHWGHLCRGRAK